MTTYWLDPFLEATTQGTGTTDTSTRNGTYAAPFSLIDFMQNSGTSQTSINGVSMADGDEVRIKGLEFSTLFQSQGNVYEAKTHASYVSYANHGELRPVTGNSSTDFAWATGDGTGKSNIYAFQNSDISSYLPGWSHPLFFAHAVSSSYYNDSSVLYHTIYTFTLPVVRIQMGYDSASDTGIEVFRVKDTYANPRANGTNNSFYFNLQHDVKISAGWTSETAQNGYSILEHMPGFFRYATIGGGDSSTDTHYDLGRLIFHTRYSAGSGYGYTRGDVDLTPNTTGGTGQLTGPIVCMVGDYYGTRLNYSAAAGQTVTFPLVTGAQRTNQTLQIGQSGTAGGGPTYKFDNYIVGNDLQFSVYSTGYLNVKFRNIYGYANLGDDGSSRITNNPSSQTATIGNVEFLSDSVIFIFDNDGASNISLTLSNANTGGNTYGSNIKTVGTAPLNSTGFNSDLPKYGPHFGALANGADGGKDAFLTELTVDANNSVLTQPLFSNANSNPITYYSVGKFALNSNNYKTTAHNLRYRNPTVAVATGIPKFFIISGEHNDYDGKPLSLIGDPYTAGVSIGSLMYNDTVSSTNVLVGQWCGQSNTSTQQAWIPLDLAVPSYTAASESLRAKVTIAYADGASNSTNRTALLRAWHRDTTQSTNFRVYSTSATAVTSSNPASPTTITLNLSNVATSGQSDITSVCLGIRLDFADNTNIQKFYIASAEIEKY